MTISNEEAQLAEAWEAGFKKGVEFSEWVSEIDYEKPDYSNPYKKEAQ